MGSIDGLDGLACCSSSVASAHGAESGATATRTATSFAKDGAEEEEGIRSVSSASPSWAPRRFHVVGDIAVIAPSTARRRDGGNMCAVVDEAALRSAGESI